MNVGRGLLALGMVVAGVLHLVFPKPYVSIMPAYLPAPAALVWISGVAEIAGGLGLRIKDRLLRSGFGHRFVAKGRFQSMMADIPVKLITHPQPGLFGAAAAFAQEHTGTQHT